MWLAKQKRKIGLSCRLGIALVVPQEKKALSKPFSDLLLLLLLLLLLFCYFFVIMDLSYVSAIEQVEMQIEK